MPQPPPSINESKNMKSLDNNVTNIAMFLIKCYHQKVSVLYRVYRSPRCCVQILPLPT